MKAYPYGKWSFVALFRCGYPNHNRVACPLPETRSEMPVCNYVCALDCALVRSCVTAPDSRPRSTPLKRPGHVPYIKQASITLSRETPARCANPTAPWSSRQVHPFSAQRGSQAPTAGHTTSCSWRRPRTPPPSPLSVSPPLMLSQLTRIPCTRCRRRHCLPRRSSLTCPAQRGQGRGSVSLEAAGTGERFGRDGTTLRFLLDFGLLCLAALPRPPRPPRPLPRPLPRPPSAAFGRGRFAGVRLPPLASPL